MRWLNQVVQVTIVNLRSIPQRLGTSLVVVIGIAGNGPAARAELKAGDVILAVDGEKVTSQSAFYRKLWALGDAGVDVPLTVHHEGVTFDVVLASTDRTKLLKGPRLH